MRRWHKVSVCDPVSLSLVSKIEIKQIVWLLRSLELVMFPDMSLWRCTDANHE